MNEGGYVVCATCGDYAVDFNAVMLDCSTCENSYHHTCVGMGLGELGRRTAATNAMRKSKGKKGGADGDGDVTGTLYDWICPDCQHQPRPHVPEPDKEEVLVIEDTDDEDEDDGERTTYIDLSYNVDIHRVAPSQRALLPTTTTARRPAVHMQNVAGLLNRTNVGASTSTKSAANSNSNIGASTSTSKPVPDSTSTSTSPQSHNATMGATTTRNVQTPLSPPPSRSPSRTGPPANGTVPFVDFTAMATSSKKRRRSSEAEDERAKKKSRVVGPAALLRTPVEPIDLTLSDDEVLVTPASRRDAASVSSADSRSRHGPGSVSSGTTDIATEDEPVPTRNLMRASLAGRTPRVPLATQASRSPLGSTVPSKRRLSASPSNSHVAPVKRAVTQKQADQEHEDDGEDDEEHAFFRSRRASGVGGGGGLTRTRSDAAILLASTSTVTPRSTVPTRTQSDSALAPAPGSGSRPSESRAPHPLEKTSIGEADEPPSRPPAPEPTPTANYRPTSSHNPHASSSSSSSRPGAIEAKATQAQSVTVQDVDADDLPDYVSDEERESTALTAASTASRVPSASTLPPAPATSSSARPTPTHTPTPATTTSTPTTTFRKPALPPPRAAAPIPSTAPVPSTAPFPSNAPIPTNDRAPAHSSTSRSQPLFLPDSPSPSPERRERESQRLMSLPPISYLEEDGDVEDEAVPGVGAWKDVDVGVDMGVDMDELEDEDELELRSYIGVGVGAGSGVVKKKKKKKRTDEVQLGLGASSTVKGKTRLHAPVPSTNDAVVDTTERRKAKKHRVEQEDHDDDAGRSYAQQIVDERLEDVSDAGLASLLDRTRAGEGESTSGSSSVKKKKHREREQLEPRTAGLPAQEEMARRAVSAGAGASVDGGEGESSTSNTVKEKKKKHGDRDRDRDQDTVNLLATPSLDLSTSLKKTKHAVVGAGAAVDAGAGDSSTSSSVKKKKKHRDGDAGVVDPLTVLSLGLSASATLGKKTKHAVFGADAAAGESSTSGSVKEKKKKHRDRDRERDAIDTLARPALGLSTSLEKTKHKHRHLDTDVGEGEASTASSVKVKKKKKHRDGDIGAGRSSTQGEGVAEQLDLLARPMIGLSASYKKTVLGADADAGESSTSSSVKKKKKHRERERDAVEGVVDGPAVPSQKTPTFKEPATPDRRVDDLTVSWGRLQELASFSPSSAKKTTTARDGESVPSTVREEASSSRQLGRKTARPPPSPTLDNSSAISSTSTRRPLAAMSAERVPVPHFPAAPAGPSSVARASSSVARASSSTSRPDVEKLKQKEKQPMQTQRARKTVSRREDRDDVPAPSSSAVPERTKAALLDRADGNDAPGKGKSTLDKYSARAVASSSSSSTVLPPSTSTFTLPPSSRRSAAVLNPSAAVRDPSGSRPSAPSTAPSSSRSKHRVADPSLPFEAPVVPRRKAIAGVDYPLPDLPLSPSKAKAKANKKPTARKVSRTALVSDEETPMEVDVDTRVHTSRKGKEKEQAITVDDDPPPPPRGKEKSVTVDRPKPPPIPRLRSASIWSSSTPTPAPSPYTTSSPSLDAVTAFLKKRRMANPLPSSSTVPSAPTQGQKMAATKRRLERGEHESDLPVPMSVLANAREMQMLRRLVKRGTVVKNTLKRSVGEVKTDVVRPFDWAQYRVESEMKEKERDEQGVGDFDAT